MNQKQNKKRFEGKFQKDIFLKKEEEKLDLNAVLVGNCGCRENRFLGSV